MTKAQEVIGSLATYNGCGCPACDGKVVEAITNSITNKHYKVDWPGIGDTWLCTVCNWSQDIGRVGAIDWGRRAGKTMRNYQDLYTGVHANGS